MKQLLAALQTIGIFAIATCLVYVLYILHPVGRLIIGGVYAIIAVISTYFNCLNTLNNEDGKENESNNS